MRTSGDGELPKGTRGEERDRYLQLMIVQQMREANAESTVTIDKSESTRTKKFIDFHNWSVEKMDQESPLLDLYWYLFSIIELLFIFPFLIC